MFRNWIMSQLGFIELITAYIRLETTFGGDLLQQKSSSINLHTSDHTKDSIY